MIRLERKHGFILLDDEDAWVTAEYYVSSVRTKTTRQGPYDVAQVTRKGTHKTESLARVLLQPGPGMQADHINNDALDNRRENLRVVDLALQSANRRSSNSWGYRGVDYPKSQQYAFRARLYRLGSCHRSGQRASPEKAALDYNRMAIAVWGHQSVINEVPCVDMNPRPSERNCMFCNAPCFCCCVCLDEPSQSMRRLFDTLSA